MGTRPLVYGPRAVAVTLALAVKGGGPNLPQRRTINLGFSFNKRLGSLEQRERGAADLLFYFY